ncbi:MAG: diaminopimelate decarboxylase [Fimbriimonadia bacterium]|nr:diaminopimelate decarboxylase [Fimbriimonadia bacterium]
MFSITQQINDQGHLQIGGIDTVALAAEFGTPLYVLDEEDFRSRCREYQRAFHTLKPDVGISYASKALLNLAVCRIIEQEGLGLDVASGGELFTAAQAAFPANRITMHGNNKSEEELCQALTIGVGTIVVDNFLELETLQSLLSPQQELRILLRVAPSIDPETHPYIRTGQTDTKFGFAVLTGDLLRAVSRVRDDSRLELAGFHCHIGSQITDLKFFEETTATMAQIAADIRDETGYATAELNIGGGLGVRYLPGDSLPDLKTYAQTIVGTLRARCAELNMPEPALLIEPGRSLVAEAGITLYRVGAIKQAPLPKGGARTYLSVDGGLSDNPRPQMYQARYHAILANKADQPAQFSYRIAGKHCETDTLIPEVLLPEAAPGDLLAIFSTGAYNASMSSNYNRLPRPAMALVRDGQADLIVQRETLTEVTQMDRLPERLR